MKRLFAVILLVCMTLSLAACDFGINGNYSKVVPHEIQNETAQPDKLEAYSYVELREALVGLVTQGAEEGIIYYPNEDSRTLASYMDVVVRHVTKEHPVGAYAVASIEHEIGTNSGVQAVAVKITYTRSTAQIRNLQKAENMDSAKSMIASALEKCEASVVFQMDSYEGTDFVQFVSDYVDEHADVCMELPRVSAMSYPEFGANRVIELVFSYQTSRDSLRTMQQNIEPIFESAELYVSSDADKWEKYAQLYSFLTGLMERHERTAQTSITPAYSLLRHGVGDSKAFSVVYVAMCRRCELPCDIITGTKDGEVYTWNVIRDGDRIYYVDLLRSERNGRFSANEADEMSGYVWDYSAYN